jgi:hypothetical protein
MNRQRKVARLLIDRLASTSVPHQISHAESGDYEQILFDGNVAVEFAWPETGRPEVKRKWPGHRPFVRIQYGGQLLRSKNELHIATLLDVHGIRWKYEWKPFRLSDGTNYLPDFATGPQAIAGSFIEVKDADMVKRLAQDVLGMPRWVDGEELSRYEVIGAIDPDLIQPELRKPYLLSRDNGENVWVVPGRTGHHQPFVVFRPDGTAQASRSCPLFEDTVKADTARAIASSFLAWPALGEWFYWEDALARKIEQFLRETWVVA